MMHIYKLDGNTMEIVSCPSRDIRKGDYIIIRDVSLNRSLIVQVMNVGYANIPGILEDILRESSLENIEGRENDFLGIQAFADIIKDAKILRCKIRRAIIKGRLSHDISWTPSRSTSQLVTITDKAFLKLIGTPTINAITLGTTKEGEDVNINLSTIDGKLNIITGKKGTGKSHLSKLLVSNLVKEGGICVVFDVNGEYINIGYDEDNEKTQLYDKVHVITPGNNFQVTLQYTGLGVFLRIISSVLDLPENSAWEIRRIWLKLMDDQALTLKNLREAIDHVTNNYVRDALIRRFDSLMSTGLFTDNPRLAATLEEYFYKAKNGGGLIINLKGLPSSFRQIIVEFMLSKMSTLLNNWIIRALFLFAEEAHLYLRKTYWEDIVTRMRHLGIFSTFITNQPDSISESIYRQADNIFLFNFTNENDLSTVSKATMVDVETVNVITKELPPRHCLVLGKVTNDFPLIVEVKPLKAKVMGQTRLFFTTVQPVRGH
jgi:DNA helicase HerA-like ATPase